MASGDKADMGKVDSTVTAETNKLITRRFLAFINTASVIAKDPVQSSEEV